jgi:hypothetical protein
MSEEFTNIIQSMIQENGYIATKIKTEFYDLFDGSKLPEAITSRLIELFHKQAKVQEVLENLYANRD